MFVELVPVAGAGDSEVNNNSQSPRPHGVILRNTSAHSPPTLKNLNKLIRLIIHMREVKDLTHHICTISLPTVSPTTL